MVNKEIILNANGSIKKDFTDRNIPQNTHNFVCVSVAIPVSCFTGLSNYSVELSASKIVGGVETILNTLAMYSAKTFKDEGVDYIKFQCLLSINYTDFIGTLKLTPYIKTTSISNGDVVVAIQQAFTNSNLNVIKSVMSNADDSMEEAEAITQLEAMINAKNIKLISDYENSDMATAILGCFEDYNATFYSGYLFIVKYEDGEFALMPYLNESATEFTRLTLDGVFSKIYNYDTNSYSELVLSYTKTQIDTLLTNYYTKSETYSKSEVDDDFVKKTTTINGKPLSSNVVITKGDVDLGNVENYGVVNSPSADAIHKYVDAGGLYTYLLNNYADKNDYDTTKAKVNELYESFKGTGDNDNVVNTLYDLIKVFENFPEANNIASILSDLEARLELVEQLQNAVLTIDGIITLDADNWVSNTGSYASDYPYKITYQNNQLIGVSYFNVVFSVDADTSLLSTTSELNETTGTITFYASDVVEDDIDIEKIVCITSLNAINTYNANFEAQVQQNTNDISDIKSNKANVSALPSGIYTSTLTLNNLTTSDQTTTKTYIKNPTGTSLKESDLFITSNGYLCKIKSISENNITFNMISKIQNPSFFTTTTDATDVSGTLYINDGSINLYTDIQGDFLLYLVNGVVSKIYKLGEKEYVSSLDEECYKVELIGEFASRLYLHCLTLSNSAGATGITCKIINNSPTAIDTTSLGTYLNANGFTTQKLYEASGMFYVTTTAYVTAGLYAVAGTSKLYGRSIADGTDYSSSVNVVIDKVIAL